MTFAFGAAEIRGLALMGLTLASMGTLAWLLYRRLGPVGPRQEMMPFLDHLEELRRRIIRSGLLVVLWTVLFLGFRLERFDVGPLALAYPVPSVYDNMAAQLYRWIALNTVPPGVQLIVSNPTEAVAAQMEIALVLGLIVSLPFLLYETWAFLAPGLASRERRFLLRALPAVVILFAAGASFGYAFVVPLLFSVLYAFAAPLGALSLFSVGALVGNVVTMVLLFGVAFQLPLFMVGMVRLGLATPQTFLRRWRHATLTIFIIAAFASDPTLTSQLVIGGLLLALYWGGILASLLLAPTRPIILPNRVSKA